MNETSDHIICESDHSAAFIYNLLPPCFCPTGPLQKQTHKRTLFCSVLLHHIHFQLQVPSCCGVIFSLRWISIASILRHLSQMLLLLRHLLYYLHLHLNVNHFSDALIILQNKIQIFLIFHCRWKTTIQVV